MIRHDANKLHVAFADGGLPEIADYIKTRSRQWRTQSSQRDNASPSWDLSVGYDGAVRLADIGWTEGAVTLSDCLGAIPPNETEPEYFHDVAGYMPDVPLYCSGDPMHMLNHGHPEGRKPVVHLIINVVAAAIVNAKAYANYGAAITGMVEQIEATGRQVELDVVFVVTHARGNRGLYGWKVKRAGDNLDLAAIAYSLAHPAAFRRLGFAMMERSPDNFETAGYGYCGSMVKDLATYINAEGAFILGGIQTAHGSCATMPEAVKFAVNEINKAAGEELVFVRG